jgi:hypothetical protein
MHTKIAVLYIGRKYAHDRRGIKFHTIYSMCIYIYIYKTGLVYIYKAVPLQARSGPEGSRKLRFPDYMKTAQDGGQVVSLTHRPPFP